MTSEGNALATIVRHPSRRDHLAVEFLYDGRPYRTAWTKYRAEAEAWEAEADRTGWIARGRPMPLDESASRFFLRLYG